MNTRSNQPEGNVNDVLEGLTYRPLRGRHEIEGIAKLYDIAGWGPSDPARLAEWLLTDGPLGPYLVMVIANERDELVGMMMYGPYRVQLFDRVGIAARGRAMILAPELRRSARNVSVIDEADPSYKLSVAARPYLDERGWEFIFGLPNPSQTRREEKLAVPEDFVTSTCEYGLALRIDPEDVPGPMPLDVTIADRFGPEYDTLWQRARDSFDIKCAVVRDASGLSHSRAGQLHLECRTRETGELLGYAVLLEKGGKKLQDVLAVDDDAMHLVIRSVVSWLRDNRDLEYFASVPYPAYRDALIAAGAYEIDWLFSFNVSTHHESDQPELDASNWYVTAGD
jgi:hypothetical protein